MAAERLLKPWKPEPQTTYIFRNANVVDTMTGSILPNRTVKISHGLIENVTNTEKDYVIIAKDNEITIDLAGKYLCPGLIDNHVHISAVPGEKNLGDIYALDKDISSMRQPTTTIHCRTRIDTDWRSWRCSRDPIIIRIVDGVPECIKAAREELRTGADFIKIMAGGGVASPTDKLENVQFTAEEVRAISTVAKNGNTYVTAHTYTPQSIRHAIDNGASGIEHGNLIDAETAKYMAERDVFLTPTLIAYAEMASPDFPGFLPIESETKNQEVLHAGVRSLQIASDAGVTICFGTDLLGPLGIAQTKEFALRAQVLSPKAILQSATINPAKRYGLTEFLGQIKPKFAADMLILNKNPFDDISIFDDPDKHLLAVIKDGRVFHSRWTKLAQDVVKAPPLIE
ncbi:Uncharacterized protein LSUE1_G009431 [Lachnellula suecica]|uniref:Amidohydrolase-related domain-containing protein n=1 Tax=Lachnellula suecica TaxID=602035 RepID=A0A8T9BZU2_9HELO|nr:Uncharacterized protein LSUE1_G009431 [Lachnellula suecica]